MILKTGQHQIKFPRRPLILGIVNINTDSFSGDGTIDVDAALMHAQRLVNEGADVIDVGGESARTNRMPISEQEEIDRVAPFIQRFRESAVQAVPVDSDQIFPPLLSINTWRTNVANCLLTEGGDILNDMSALPDVTHAQLAAKFHVALLIMHSIGLPKEKHTHVFYENVCETVDRFFEEKIEEAVKAGLDRNAIILDPGLDFAKQRDDNLKLLANLVGLKRFERPILLPVSRKTVIGEVLHLETPQDRDAGTVACIVGGLLRGASLFRVHNVRAASQAVRALWGTEDRSQETGDRR